MEAGNANGSFSLNRSVSHGLQQLSLRGFIGTQSAILNRSRGDERALLDDAVHVYVQGTLFDTEEIRRKVHEFLTSFRPAAEQLLERRDEPFYMEELRQIRETDVFSLVIKATHVYEFSRDLYFKLVYYPPEVISLFDAEAKAIFTAAFLPPAERAGFARSIFTIFVALRQTSQIRDVAFDQINHLVALRGIVVRVSDIYPEMKVAFMRCALCALGEEVKVERGLIREPARCRRCLAQHSFELVHNFSTFTDKQIIKLQETPERVPEGGMPAHINVLVYDDLVDHVMPGDAIEVVGIFRAQPVRVNPHTAELGAVFRTYVDVVSITFCHNGKVVTDAENSREVEHSSFSDAEVEAFKRLARRPDVYEQLLASFAPSILELRDTKKGLLCQLFGGAEKNFDPDFKARFRNEINLLMVGDPSTAKSQLLQFVHKISPRGVFTSGKGSSAVGLTAYIMKDPETGEMILESGALVISDKGICCIDELDKMDEGTAGILHEAMEQQTISIAKAGIVCSLNARTAVLAAANPKESRYNCARSLVYNLNMPSSILSRFDMIYVMLDVVSEAYDARLAAHLLGLFSGRAAEPAEAALSGAFLSKYIRYARLHCAPRLSEAAAALAVAGYVELRKIGRSSNTVSATPRQLESVIRIGEALAKMRLSPEVTAPDVAEAIRLVKDALLVAATDPTTGKIDLNAIMTGYSAATKDTINRVSEELKQMMVKQDEAFKQGIFASELIKALEAALRARGQPASVSREELFEALKLLEFSKRLRIFGGPWAEKFSVKLIPTDP